MKKIFLSLLALSLSFNISANEKVHVVASIKPLQLVAQDLVGELGDVDVLIPAGASPHHYNLKPSDLRKLAKTNLVVWVGPDMEQFLSKTLHRHEGAVLQLMEGEEGEEHQDGHHDDHHDDHEGHHKEDAHHGHHEHDHGDIDPHIWMYPVLMIAAADQIRDELVKQFPKLESQLDANFSEFKSKVEQADQSITEQLAPYKDKGFVVFHDAFSLLVGHYKLNQLAFFTFDPSHPPGAKKVAKIQSLMKSKQAVCVFSEPQFEAKVVQRVTAGMDINKGELDPLAIETTPEQGYIGFLQGLADNIEHCLK